MPGSKTFWFISGFVLVSLFSLTAEGDQEGLQESQQKEASRYQEAIGEYRKEREMMVDDQIERRGVKDPLVLEAMNSVPRHLFVPANQQKKAYNDYPLPIGYGQTISQPYIVAYMTELLRMKPGDKILEIGTGSGYQAAVLAHITDQVYTVEIIRELAERTMKLVEELGYRDRVHIKVADGYYGWEEYAPYDGIIVTAAAGHVPPSLIEQLKPGGRIVIPVGAVYQVQTLMVITKTEEGEIKTRSMLPVRFVPMTGHMQE